MMFRCVDVHCHISFDAYDSDREVLLQKMKDAHVGGIVVGVDASSSRGAVELAQRHEHLSATIGLHPNYTDKEIWDREFFETLAKNKVVVGIGECGLDYYRPIDVTEALKQHQQDMFRAQVLFAAEIDTPLMIHARPSRGTMDAYHDVIEILEEVKKVHGARVRGNIHFFVGGVAEATRFVSLGFTMSYTAVITFARDYDEVIRSIPEEYLLAETDAPYVAPLSRRGERNDPLSVQDVVREMARIRGVSEEQMQARVLQNTSRVFGFPALGEDCRSTRAVVG